jgi:hypothetical protein
MTRTTALLERSLLSKVDQVAIRKVSTASDG